MSGKRGKKHRCFWCDSAEFPRKSVMLWRGKWVLYCQDGEACVRRKQESDT